MKPGDLVTLTGSYRCALLVDRPSNHVADDPGRTGEIVHHELCLVLEVSGAGLDRWVRVLSANTNVTGWIEGQLMDQVAD
jgi:hypothetical protein